MIRTELELAIRVVVDLKSGTTAQERAILQRSLELAKEIHRLRGTSDSALGAVEAQLATLPAQVEVPAWITRIPLRWQDLCVRIVAGERAGTPREWIARDLGLTSRTIRRLIRRFALDAVVTALGPVDTA